MHFPEFYSFPKFSDYFEKILVNVRCQFSLADEFIGQDGAILPDDLPIKIVRKQSKMSSYIIIPCSKSAHNPLAFTHFF